MLCRDHFNTNYDVLMGSAPAAMASAGCDCTILPVRNRREIFSSDNAEASQCAMSPKWGLDWRKGGDHHLKRGILQSKKLFPFSFCE
jgi:hypothetical protein